MYCIATNKQLIRDSPGWISQYILLFLTMSTFSKYNVHTMDENYYLLQSRADLVLSIL